MHSCTLLASAAPQRALPELCQQLVRRRPRHVGSGSHLAIAAGMSASPYGFSWLEMKGRHRRWGSMQLIACMADAASQAQSYGGTSTGGTGIASLLGRAKFPDACTMAGSRRLPACLMSTSLHHKDAVQRVQHRHGSASGAQSVLLCKHTSAVTGRGAAAAVQFSRCPGSAQLSAALQPVRTMRVLQ